MKVSVVLATCNGAKFLSEQLDSLAKQTRLPDELLIGDDASEDDTVRIAMAFAETTPFITKVIKNAHRLGYAQNFSLLATQATGDILFFCDQDDVWHPSKIAVVEQHFLDCKKTRCLIHDVALIDHERNHINPSLLSQLSKSAGASHQYVKGCATALEADFAKAIFPLPPGSHWTHDSISHVAATIMDVRRVLPEILVDYRIHERNISGFIAGKPTLRQRLNATIDRLEMHAAPAGLYPLPIPKRCTEQDMEFLLGALSRTPIADLHASPAMRSYLLALGSIASTRLQAENASLCAGLKVAMDKYRAGEFNALGGIRVLAIECFWIMLKSLIRHDRISISGGTRSTSPKN